MTSPLATLNRTQWESLCDGCGRCCLVKLEDEDTGELCYTNVACRYLDLGTCRCTDYQNRATKNPRCMVLSLDNLEALDMMPNTCAYRLFHEGRNLNQDPEELKVSGQVVSEDYIHEDQLPDHIVQWVTVRSP